MTQDHIESRRARTLARFAIAGSVVLALASTAVLLIPAAPRQEPAFDREEAAAVLQSDFREIAWPFPIDQWGRGKAFECAAEQCGRKVLLYVRAKIGGCNCATGVADDAELERVSDFNLIGDRVDALGSGRPIAVGWMKGLSRSYRLNATSRPGPSALSIAFNDRCDAIVATAVVQDDQPGGVETHVIDFLNTPPVIRWARTTLGL